MRVFRELFSKSSLNLNSGFALVYCGNDSHIEFWGAVDVVEETVLFLLNVGELGIAETAHHGIVEDGIGKCLVSFIKLFKAVSGFSVAPSALSALGEAVLLKSEADSAVFGYHYGLALPALTDLADTVVKIVFLVELVVVLFEESVILFVIVNVKNVGNYVIIAAGVNTRTGRIEDLRLTVDNVYESRVASLCLRTVIPCLVEGHPTYDRRMVEIALYSRKPVGKIVCNTGKI